MVSKITLFRSADKGNWLGFLKTVVLATLPFSMTVSHLIVRDSGSSHPHKQGYSARESSGHVHIFMNWNVNTASASQ